MSERTPAENIFSRAVSRHALAEAHFVAGDLPGALKAAREAVAAWEEGLRLESPDYANLLITLARVLDGSALYSEAEQRARQALMFLERLPVDQKGPESDQLIVRALRLLGTALREQGRFDEAEPPLRRALKASYEFPESPGLIAAAANDLGILCKQLGRASEAEDFYRRALKLCEDHPQEGGIALPMVCFNLGSLAESLDKNEIAEFWYEKAREVKKTLSAAGGEK